MMRIWLWPVVIAVLSAAGLIAGLVSEGAGDWLSWLALAAPSPSACRACHVAAPAHRHAAATLPLQDIGELVEAERLGQ